MPGGAGGTVGGGHRAGLARGSAAHAGPRCGVCEQAARARLDALARGGQQIVVRQAGGAGARGVLARSAASRALFTGCGYSDVAQRTCFRTAV